MRLLAVFTALFINSFQALAIPQFIVTKIGTANLPKIVSDHLIRNFDHINKVIDLGYSQSQIKLVISHYADALIDEYKSFFQANTNKDKLQTLLMSLINHMQTISEPKTDDEFTKIEVPYKDLIIPLFIKQGFSGELQIYLFGIQKNSLISAPFGEANPLSSSLECLQMTLDGDEAEINTLNSYYTACPVPEKAGSFMIKLAEWIASRAGYKRINLHDISTIRCKKNDDITSLARLKVFQEGKTWYESHGYSSNGSKGEGILRMQSSAPLLNIQSELGNIAQKELPKLKTSLLARVSDEVEKEIIEKDFTDFAILKRKFDEKIDEFMKNYKSSGAPSLGKFYSSLWSQDCAIYIELVNFLFRSKATSGLSIRPFGGIPNDLSRSLPAPKGSPIDNLDDLRSRLVLKVSEGKE